MTFGMKFRMTLKMTFGMISRMTLKMTLKTWDFRVVSEEDFEGCLWETWMGMPKGTSDGDSTTCLTKFFRAQYMQEISRRSYLCTGVKFITTANNLLTRIATSKKLLSVQGRDIVITFHHFTLRLRPTDNANGQWRHHQMSEQSSRCSQERQTC